MSAIIPTYNRAATLRATLDSAIDQTYENLEIVVVDDGSTDETSEVLAGFPDIVNVRQENRGVAAARNTGVARATGSIIMFLDSDDLWFPAAVETHVRLLEAAGPGVPCSMCNLTLRGANGDDVSMFTERKLRPRHAEGLWSNVGDVLATRFLFTNQTLAIRRQAFDDVGVFDESLWVMEDFDLAMRLSTLTPWVFTSRTLALRVEGSDHSLTTMASRDRERLNATIVAICAKIQSEGLARSTTARFAIANMRRRAMREMQEDESVSSSKRAIMRSWRFVDTEVLERAYRNSWLYPRIESSPL